MTHESSDTASVCRPSNYCRQGKDKTVAGAHPLSPATCKTILFVTRTHEFGGAEKHLLELIHRLIGCEVRLSILCLETDFYTERLHQNHVNIITRKSGLKSF